MSKTKFTAKDIFNRLTGIEDKLSSNQTDKDNEPKKEKTEKFAEVTLADGETVLSYDGELAAGTAIFVVGEDGEQLPAPEGTHELGGDMAGTSIIVNAEGIIEEVVTEEAAASEEEEQAMSSEDMQVEIAKAIDKALEEVINRFSKIEKENEAFKAEIEKLKDAPSDKKEVKKKFNREDSGLSPRQQWILSERKK